MKVEDCTSGEIKVLNIKPTASSWMEVLVDNKKADPEGIWSMRKDYEGFAHCRIIKL